MVSHSKNSGAIIQEARLCLLASSTIQNSSDPSDGMLILFSGSLSKLDGKIFVPQELSDLLLDDFGWSIPPSAIEFFVPKMKKMGWLKSQPGLSASGPFLVEISNIDEVAGTQEKLQNIGNRFIEYSKQTSPINILPTDDIDAAVILLQQAVDLDAEKSFFGKSNLTSEESYLSSAFIEYLKKSRDPLFEDLIGLSALGFLLRVADEFGSPTKTQSKRDLIVILDGPLILDCLGCNGPIRKDAISEVVADLLILGTRIATYSHCVDEAYNALKSVLQANPRDRHGPTGNALRSGSVNEVALNGILNSLDAAVKSLNITVIADKIESNPSSHQYFNDNQVSEIEKIINWHDFDKEKARFRDLSSVAITMRRRKAYRSSDIFDSKYIFITNNNVFSGATFRHLKEISYYNSKQIPPVVQLKELAAKIWIEVGNGAKGKNLKIPRSQLLLSCDRSLNLNRSVVEKAKRELALVRPEQLEQFELLLEVPRSARAVMDATLNSEKYVTGTNILELVEKAVEAAGREIAAKERMLREKAEKKHIEVIENAKNRENEIKNEMSNSLSKIEMEKDFVSNELEEAQRKNKIIQQRKLQDDQLIIDAILEEKSNLMQTIVVLIKLLFVFCAICAAIVTLRDITFFINNYTYLLFVILVFGSSILSAFDKPGGWLTKKIRAHCLRQAEDKVRSISRGELLNAIQIEWIDDKMSWEYCVDPSQDY